MKKELLKIIAVASTGSTSAVILYSAGWSFFGMCYWDVLLGCVIFGMCYWATVKEPARVI